MNKYLIVIGGATATGKTAMSIKLAQHFQTAVLSADSRQFYRGMDIGTAKPTPAELDAVKHYFINSIKVETPYSVGDFERDALAVLANIYKTNDWAILSGGSGLFINALCEGLDQFPDIPPDVKTAIAEGEAAGGLGWLQSELQRLDPVWYAKIDLQNPARLRRAISVSLASGVPYSTFVAGSKKPRPFIPIFIQLDLPRPVLYKRIDDRVDAMVAEDLVEEVRQFLPFRHLQALNTVGYTEIFDYFDGKCTLAESIDKVKQHSRNYAKRQGTWFRKYGNWKVFHPENIDDILAWIDAEATKFNGQ